MSIACARGTGLWAASGYLAKTVRCAIITMVWTHQQVGMPGTTTKAFKLSEPMGVFFSHPSTPYRVNNPQSKSKRAHTQTAWSFCQNDLKVMWFTGWGKCFISCQLKKKKKKDGAFHWSYNWKCCVRDLFAQKSFSPLAIWLSFVDL